MRAIWRRSSIRAACGSASVLGHERRDASGPARLRPIVRLLRIEFEKRRAPRPLSPFADAAIVTAGDGDATPGWPASGQGAVRIASATSHSASSTAISGTPATPTATSRVRSVSGDDPAAGRRRPRRAARAAAARRRSRSVPAGSAPGRPSSPSPSMAGPDLSASDAAVGVEGPQGHARFDDRDRQRVVEQVAADEPALQHPLERQLLDRGRLSRRGRARCGGRRRGRPTGSAASASLIACGAGEAVGEDRAAAA